MSVSEPFEPEQITDLMDDVEERVTTLDADRRAGKTITHDRMIRAFIDGANLTVFIDGMTDVINKYKAYLDTIMTTLHDFDEYEQAAIIDAARHRVQTEEDN